MKTNTQETNRKGQPASASGACPVLWTVEYEWGNRCWQTVAEGETREEAMRHFRRDNPDVEIRECWQ